MRRGDTLHVHRGLGFEKLHACNRNVNVLTSKGRQACSTSAAGGHSQCCMLHAHAPKKARESSRYARDRAVAVAPCCCSQREAAAAARNSAASAGRPARNSRHWMSDRSWGNRGGRGEPAQFASEMVMPALLDRQWM